MKIAVLSGKGGAGKTLVSVNLADICEDSTYIDCDVEEPNGHLFFSPKDIKEEKVNILLPTQNIELCNGCRKCVDFCKFNALAFIKKKIFLFDDVCHSCNGCVMVCPTNALTMKEKEIGCIKDGMHNNTRVISGELNLGEASGVPIIKALLNKKTTKNTIIDCPPGSACVVMESIKKADYCVIVAEPTVFGVHNLDMVYELTKVLNKDTGVILNKCDGEKNLAKEYCVNNNIKILGQIPWNTNLARISSNGEIAVEKSKEYHDIFENILKNIEMEANKCVSL